MSGIMRFAAVVLVLFGLVQTASASKDDVVVMEGVYHCGPIPLGLTLYMGPLNESSRFEGIYHFYPADSNPAAREGCYKAAGKLDVANNQIRFKPIEWILQPAGYQAVDIQTDVNDLPAGHATAQINHPSCNQPFRLSVTKSSRALPAACASVLTAIAATGAAEPQRQQEKPEAKLTAIATAGAAAHPVDTHKSKPAVVYQYPVSLGGDLACDFGVYRCVPRWGEEAKYNKTCDFAQGVYRGKLYGFALDKSKPAGKQNLYAISTFLGYFSDDPVEMEEIAEKNAPVIGRDYEEFVQLIEKSPYLFFWGSSDGKYHYGETLFDLGTGSVHYEWERDQVVVYGPFLQSIKPRDTAIGRSIDNLEFQVSAREWRDKYQPYFGDAQGNGAKKPWAVRLLTDAHFNAVLADIYDAKTGKSIIRWGGKGVDLDAVSKLVPEKPLASYKANAYGCKSLNTKYFKPTK